MFDTNVEDGRITIQLKKDGPYEDAAELFGTDDIFEIRNKISNVLYNDTRLESFIEFMNHKGIKMEGKVEFSYDEWSVDLGGIFIHSDAPKSFMLSYSVYDSGSYWEPPSEDYVEFGTYKDLTTALFAAYSLMLNMEYDNYCEGKYWESQKDEKFEEIY